MIKVVVSGYFTVLHKGHVRLFEEAKKLGDKLIVIVNNDKQQKKKKGRLVHKCEDIKYIIERLECVDEVIISIDNNSTVCRTLESIRPNIFANGGDRIKDNIPEYELCQKLGIETSFKIGGSKHNSSTAILMKNKDV